MRNAGRMAAVALVVGAVLALPASAAAPESQPGITVTGNASVPAVPDEAEWSFGVSVRAASASGALRSAGARSRAIVTALREAGVARADIQTENVSLYPRIDERTNEVRGFTASASVQVVVRSLGRAGRVIQAAVDAGATDVYGPSLSASNREELYAQALEQAFDGARAKAERLARKLGVSLGAPVAVVEGRASDEFSYAETAALDAAFAIEPGQTDIPASVTVTFSIS